MKATQPSALSTISLDQYDGFSLTCTRLKHSLLNRQIEKGEQKMARGEHLLLSRAPVRVISEQETRV